MMARSIKVADCVCLPDGRMGRVRAVLGMKARAHVRRKTSETHQFVLLFAEHLKPIECPKDWMSPRGYSRYLRITLTKMQNCRTRGIQQRSRGRWPFPQTDSAPLVRLQAGCVEG